MSNRVLFALAVLDPGRDGPGILASLTSVLRDLGCNAEDVLSKPLSGHCATVLTALGPPDVEEPDLFDSIHAALEARNWRFAIWPLPDSLPPSAAGSAFYASLTGPDRRGIVSAVTGVLMNRLANIVSLDCSITDRRSQYVVIVRGTLPADENRERRAELVRRRQFEDELYDLADGLGLYIEVGWEAAP